MIFINTRPVDEAALQGERRASKAVSQHSLGGHQGDRKVHMTRLVLCLLMFYVFVSVFPALLFYPTSLVSFFVPFVLLLFAICKIRGENRSDQWPCIMVGMIGILIKIAAVVIYIMVFPSSDDKKSGNSPIRQARADLSLRQYRTAFFVVLVCIEVFVLLVGGCLKWHLVAFEKMENDAKTRRMTLTSNRPLISEQVSRRTSQA